MKEHVDADLFRVYARLAGRLRIALILRKNGDLSREQLFNILDHPLA